MIVRPRDALISLLLAVAPTMAATLATLKSDAAVYPSERRRVYERPLLTLRKGDVVEVTRRSGVLALIRARTGRQGWVELVRLDTNDRPPLLGIVESSTKAPPTTPEEDAQIVKRWIETQAGKTSDTVSSQPQKRLDFSNGASDIQPRQQQDSSTKH